MELQQKLKEVWNRSAEVGLENDIVVYPDGTIIEDDMDELESALQSGDISQQQFDLAINTSNKLKNGLLNNPAAFKGYIDKAYKLAKQ